VVIATASTLPGPVLVLTSHAGDLTALSAGVPGISVRAV